jgi:hypothetical protein
VLPASAISAFKIARKYNLSNSNYRVEAILNCTRNPSKDLPALSLAGQNLLGGNCKCFEKQALNLTSLPMQQ